MLAAPVRPHLRVLPHIRRALDAGSPVVALESSVLAQGLPIPANRDAAKRMMEAVESTRATPAITAVAAGQPAVGLEPAELDRFLERTNVRKVSARDLGAAVAAGVDGSTTVAGAMALATQAGIRVLATGGIGGVHRRVQADSPVDESADLHELARTPMVVVCSGAKSILDLPATWERLDTYGVPVIGFATDELPGFFTARTGIRLTTRADSVDEVAAIARAHFGLGRNQSVLVVQPPPTRFAIDSEIIDRAVEAALARAETEGVRGGEVTPFLLSAVSKETGGQTLETNLALLESNSRLAGAVARALGDE